MTTKTARLQSVLSSLWTTADVAERFEVTGQTIHNWRAMEADPLPTLVLPHRHRPSIRFIPDDVRAWAARQKLSFKG